MELTTEEIQLVKDTGICHNEVLIWHPNNVAIDDVIASYDQAACIVCDTIFRKTREVVPPSEPVIINLDEI